MGRNRCLSFTQIRIMESDMAEALRIVELWVIKPGFQDHLKKQIRYYETTRAKRRLTRNELLRYLKYTAMVDVAKSYLDFLEDTFGMVAEARKRREE